MTTIHRISIFGNVVNVNSIFAICHDLITYRMNKQRKNILQSGTNPIPTNSNGVKLDAILRQLHVVQLQHYPQHNCLLH